MAKDMYRTGPVNLGYENATQVEFLLAMEETTMSRGYSAG
jgi:hypothetical protein